MLLKSIQRFELNLVHQFHLGLHRLVARVFDFALFLLARLLGLGDCVLSFLSLRIYSSLHFYIRHGVRLHLPVKVDRAGVPLLALVTERDLGRMMVHKLLALGQLTALGVDFRHNELARRVLRLDE